MSYASTGKGVGNMKHEEFISWLKLQRVEFTREDFVNSFEQFEGEFRKQLEILTDTIGLEPATEERICKELHALIKRSCKDTEKPHEVISNCFHKTMNADTKKSLATTTRLMKDGYEMVVEELIVNPIYNPSLNPWGKGVSDSNGEIEKSPKRYKDKKKEERSKKRSPSPNKSKSSKDDKKPNEGTPRPKCPGCGTWLSDYHTTESCTWIKEKKKGYNPNWETESWEESDAGKKAKEQGTYFLPEIRKADPKKGTECEACLMTSSCDTCHLI